MSDSELRTFTVLVEDVPGALNRVASLFRRRSFNIESLTVGRTHQDGVSRMTIVVRGDDRMGRLVEANLYKMVNVLAVEDLTHDPMVDKNLNLIRVAATREQRAEVLQICEVFRAKAVDLAESSMIVEITGSRQKIDGFLALMEPFGITEMAQSGRVAMKRGVVADVETKIHDKASATRLSVA